MLILSFHQLMTPVPGVIGRDEPWSLFHLWRHHLGSNMASSILNFSRRKESFQWYPDQSDQLNEAWNTHDDAQKVKWKIKSKISRSYEWVLHGKNCLSRWRFLRIFCTGSKPSRRSITPLKRKEKWKKGKAMLASRRILLSSVTFTCSARYVTSPVHAYSTGGMWLVNWFSFGNTRAPSRRDGMTTSHWKKSILKVRQ